jgi:hypothetical protein
MPRLTSQHQRETKTSRGGEHELRKKPTKGKAAELIDVTQRATDLMHDRLNLLSLVC